jgi:hypothetical protein
MHISSLKSQEVAGRKSLIRHEGPQSGVEMALLSTKIAHLRAPDLDRESRDALAESLKYPEMNSRKDIHSQHSTFGWLYSGVKLDTTSPDFHLSKLNGDKPLGNGQRKHFDEWVRSESKIYWINGKRGSGKSTLMKFVTKIVAPYPH